MSGHFLSVTTNEFVYKSKFGTAKCSKGYICTCTVFTMRPFTLQPRLVLCSSWFKLGMVCWSTTWTRLKLEVWHQRIAPNASSVAMLAGVGIAPWQSTRLMINLQSVMGLSPSRSCGRIFFSIVNFLCSLLFWYLFHPCVTPVAVDPGHSAKSVGCRLQLNTHAPYASGFE